MEFTLQLLLQTPVNNSDQLIEKEIFEMIQNLSPGYRNVFILYKIEGYRHREIADILGICEGTSKSQLKRAKHALRKKF